MTALPPNWQICRKEESKNSRPFYYYDTVQHVSQWLRPCPLPGNDMAWPEYFHVAHILIKHNKSRNPRTHNKSKQYLDLSKMQPEQALGIIKSLRNEIIRGEKSFESVAREESDCASYQTSGDLSWSLTAKFDPTFVLKCRKLKIGEISEPFETPSGWHIAKRLDGCIVASQCYNNPPPPTSVPPPAKFDFFIPKDVDAKPFAENARHLYRFQLLIELQPTHLENWTKFLDKYNSLAGFFSSLHQMAIRSMLYFFPGDVNAFSYSVNILKKYNRLDMYQDLLSTIRTYTWNPTFWTSYPEEGSNSARWQKAMMDNVGSTVDISAYWLRYINALQEMQAPKSEILSEVRRALDIGLENTSKLFEKLNELDPSLVDYYKQREKELKPFIERRKLMARNSNQPIKSATAVISCNNSSSLPPDALKKEEERFLKWRNFLNAELQNEANYSPDIFLQVMDYDYRLALGTLWLMPSIWIEYWSFLIGHDMKEKAEKILTIAKKAVGDTPLFELRRAQFFIESASLEDAQLIYKHLIENNGEPLLTSAMTLLFKCTVQLGNEQAAMQIIREMLQYAKPQFFINAAKLCQNVDNAWTILQMGVDHFPSNTQLIIEAAEFLEQHRDVRNTRLLFQQSLAEKNLVPFDIKKRLFQFELDHIAPLDHLNETQKVFKTTNVDPSILYMHRFKFDDLYPLDPQELKVWGHLNNSKSIDLVDTHPNSEYLTSTIPYKCNGDELKIDTNWVKVTEDNESKIRTTDGQQVPIPREIHHLLKAVADIKIVINPIKNNELVIDKIRDYQIKDYRNIMPPANNSGFRQYQPLQQMGGYQGYG